MEFATLDIPGLIIIPGSRPGVAAIELTKIIKTIWGSNGHLDNGKEGGR